MSRYGGMSPTSTGAGNYDTDLERMRNKVAMPYVKGKVQGAAMAQFKSIMQGLVKGKNSKLVRQRPFSCHCYPARSLTRAAPLMR